MNREVEATGKTVEEAYAAGCAALGVSADDLNVSYEVLEFPVKKLFKSIPAKVKVTAEEPDAPKVSAAKAAPAPRAEVPAAPKAPEKAAAPAAAKTAEKPAADEAEVAIDLSQNAKVKAAVDYLAEVAGLMGVQNAQFTAVQKGEATIVKVEGDELGALIGRRGETMESLSYLASLVANRMEGDYIKLGLDVAGYRGKREQDLTALAQRIGEKVRRTGRAFAMEPMNPYERRIIHGAVSTVKGATSSSTGVEPNRRVVISSTVPPTGGKEGSREGGRGGRNGRGGNRRGNGGRGNGGERRSRPAGERRPRLEDPPAIGGPVRREQAETAPKSEKSAVEQEILSANTGKRYGKIDI